MLNYCKANNKVPVFYAYVIAYEARVAQGIQDCNVQNYNNLCTNGADYIRNNRQFLVNRYSYQAANIASTYGSSSTVVFLMEPDFLYVFDFSSQTPIAFQ